MYFAKQRPYFFALSLNPSSTITCLYRKIKVVKTVAMIRLRLENLDVIDTILFHNTQEAQGLGVLLDKMEDNDHINWITQRSRCIVHSN